MTFRFAPTGPTAIDPRSFGMMLAKPFVRPEPETRDGVAIVRVRGPLEQHPSMWSDSYADLTLRFSEALAERPVAVLLVIDSPGGVAMGGFETPKVLRTMAEAASVPLFAYVDGIAASAAYALACVAQKVFASREAIIGSIGVIDALVDARAADASMGLRYELLASGGRKSDGNVHAEISPAAVAARQGVVDELAEVFFGHVAAARGMSPDYVRALDGGVFVAATAMDHGLVDGICSLSEAVTAARGAPAPTLTRPAPMTRSAPKIAEITTLMNKAAGVAPPPPRPAAPAAHAEDRTLVPRLAAAADNFAAQHGRRPTASDMEAWALAEIREPGSMHVAIAETEAIDRAMGIRADGSASVPGQGLPTLTPREARAELARRRSLGR